MSGNLNCSFCQKSQDIVRLLIASPADSDKVYICDECVAVCNSLLEEKQLDSRTPSNETSISGKGRRLVISVHGIRTFGAWQEDLSKMLVAEFGDSIVVNSYRYGFFTILAFLIPPLRWLATRRFRYHLMKQAAREHWSRIDLVAHSFGIHLVAWSLIRIPEPRRPSIHTIVLAGSVLKSTSPIMNLVGGSVTRLVNDCGIKDDVLIVNQLFVLFTGMAGGKAMRDFFRAGATFVAIE
jgi:hypothetical protein